MKYFLYALLLCSSFLVHGFAQITINEAMPSNYATTLDEDFYPSDWLELYNPSEQKINLSGYRISDKDNFSKAYILPNIEMQPKAYKTLFASSKPMPANKRYIIENSAYGVPHRDDRDEFHYEYMQISGDFTAELSLHSMRNAAHESVAGLMLRKEIDIESEYVGVFCKAASHKGIMSQCRIAKAQPSTYVFPAFIIEYPEEVVQLTRIGDTVYTFYKYNDIHIVKHGAFYFPHSEPMYLGIAGSSGDRNYNSVNAFNHLIINNDTIRYDNLTKAEIGALSKSKTYYSDEIHLNFKLSDSGESIFLWNPNGELISKLIIPTIDGNIPCDISVAIKDNDPNNTVFSAPATPGKANANYFVGIAEMPSIQYAKQWADSPFKVKIINNEPDSKIYYTLNGNTPTSSSMLYDGSDISIDSNTIVRAIAIKDSYINSRISTRSFFVKDSSSLPIISIAVDSISLWDEDKGMFVNKNIHTAPEVPAHIELFDANKNQKFNSDCGLHLHGNVTRIYDQKSLRLSAKRQFGPSEWSFPFFDNKSEPISESFIIRNAGNDWTGSYLRDGIMALASEQLRNTETMAFKSYLSFINGQFWGLYNMRERIDEEYLALKYDINKESINFIASNDEVKSGSLKAFDDFQHEAKSKNMSIPEDYKYMTDRVDIDAFIDYTFAELYCFNHDWITNNVKVWNSEEYDGKWRWIIFDMDFGLGWEGSVPYGNFMPAVFKPDTSRYSAIACKLLESEDFRIKFYNRSCDLLNTHFSAANMLAITDSLANIIRPEIARQQARWSKSCVNWQQKLDRVRWWVSLRADSMPSNFIDFFQLSGRTKLQFSDKIDDKAYIKLSTLQLQSFPWAGTYFKQVPISLEVLPLPGYEFINWEINGIKYFDKSIVLSPDSDIMQINVNFREVTAAANIVINEIMYKSSNQSPDWIELYNPATEQIDISNWIIKDSDDTHIFAIQANTILKPNQFLVITGDTSAFRNVYVQKIDLVGNMNFGLGKEDMVRLYNSTGNLIDSVSYTSATPWYSSCYGGGSSLELNNWKSDNTIASNWTPSAGQGGTPGLYNSVTSVSDGGSIHYSLYPNPFSEGFIVSFHSPNSTYSKVELVNLLGEIIESKSIIISKGENIISFDGIAYLPKSIYFVRISATEILNATPIYLPLIKE